MTVAMPSVGADDAGAGEVFLSARRDVGEHGLDAFEALVNLAAKILNHDAGDREGQKGIHRKLGADLEHVTHGQRGENDRVGGIHDCRAQQIAHGVQVVGSAGHDVAGAVALIVGVRKAFEVSEQIVAQVKFDVARNADDYPAGQELEDALGDKNGDHGQRVLHELLGGHSGMEIVGRMAENLRKLNRNRVSE